MSESIYAGLLVLPDAKQQDRAQDRAAEMLLDQMKQMREVLEERLIGFWQRPARQRLALYERFQPWTTEPGATVDGWLAVEKELGSGAAVYLTKHWAMLYAIDAAEVRRELRDYRDILKRDAAKREADAREAAG